MTRPARGTARVRADARAGHTLAEMVAALAIIGIVATAVAPALRPARDDGATRATRAVVALLDSARATAMRRGTVVTVVVDAVANRAWVATGADEMPTDARAIDVGERGTLDAAGRRARWVFTPAGMAFGDALVVRDGARAVRIRVDTWTGEPHAEPW